MTTVLAFVFTLAVLIVVHEYGHYRVARWSGVRVMRFSVGFGRVIWRHQANPEATEFTLSALPLGGYVRMLDTREGPVEPEALQQAFDKKPVLARVAIVAAGPLANLGLAIVLYAASAWWGVEEPRAVVSAPAIGSVADRAGLKSGDWVRAWSDADAEWHDIQSYTELRRAAARAGLAGVDLMLHVTDRQGAHAHELSLKLADSTEREWDLPAFKRLGLGAPFSDPVLGDVKPQGPAAKAGLRAGDRVWSVDGQVVSDAQALREIIRIHPEKDLVFLVERSQVRQEVVVRPRALVEGDKTLGRIDAVVGQPPMLDRVQYGFWAGAQAGRERTWDMATLSLRMFGRMLTGEASLKNLSGPLTIADFAGQTAQHGLGDFLSFLAMVSVSLGVLNLLPLPMLDGGHLMYYLFEGMTGRPVSDLWLKWLQRGGAFVLLLMMSIALSNDVARLLGLQ